MIRRPFREHREHRLGLGAVNLGYTVSAIFRLVTTPAVSVSAKRAWYTATLPSQPQEDMYS